jgi:hypothetical protein
MANTSRLETFVTCFLLGIIVTLFIVLILTWSYREEISVQHAPNGLYPDFRCNLAVRIWNLLCGYDMFAGTEPIRGMRGHTGKYS